jgi:outer membrane protein OmpA-like peptidoglycan-associated protein
MAKGIKKIKWEGKDAGVVITNLSIPNRLLTIHPDKVAWFIVGEWYDGTTPQDKLKKITWMWNNNGRDIVIRGRTILSGMKYGVQLPKKLCGPYSYFLDASITGKSSLSESVGLYFRGYCGPKVTSSKWAVSNDGKDVRNSQVFSYGHIVHLNLETEGLNGNTLIIEIYNEQLGDDRLIQTYTNVKVIDGEVNLQIKNTSTWRARLRYVSGEEKFYIKVKEQTKGHYILKPNKEATHARFLRIKDDVVAQHPERPQNNTPLKIGQSNINRERFDPCKFDAISIKETEKKDGKVTETKISVFEKGMKTINIEKKPDTITKTIFFDFDRFDINAESNKTLSNISGFLLEHEYSDIKIHGYACVIGKENYNLGLSQRRSDAVKKFFAAVKLDPTRITSIGKGEINATDKKEQGDDIKHKDEKVYKEARRVDVSFQFYGHDAQTIVYETIAPSVTTKKDLEIEITSFDTKSCFREKNKHKKEIKIIDVGQIEDKSDVTSIASPPKFNYKVYSDLWRFNLMPIQYIWPKGTTPNKFYIHTHSCRYFSNDEHASLVILAYPDIKWTLKFFINLTNDLSVKWMNMDPHEHKELQKKAGKIGAEKRWKQKDAAFGFSLKAKWENDKQEQELKYEYEAKFKKLYDLFSSIGALSDGITNKTKGKIRSVSAKGIPVSFIVKPPNLELTGDWFLSHPKDNNKILGTDISIGFNAQPLIGLEITIDLLGAIIFGVSGFFSGGTAAKGVTELYQRIQGKLKDGIEVGDEKNGLKANVDIYMDLIISNTISIDTGIKNFNTAGRAKDSKFELKAENKLKVELKVGIKIKGEAAIVIIKVTAYFEASASAEASVTFGHGVNYDEKGLYYRPILGFDGLDAKYIIYISASLAMKIVKDKSKVEESREGKYEIAKGDFKGVIPPFDVIKELEELFGISANIPLIKN